MSRCDDSGHHSRKHPVMPFSSRHSTPGFWTRDSPYLPHVDSVASSFRILVTFAIVLEVRGISFFQYHEPSWQKFFWTKRSQQECSRWVLHSILWICQFYHSTWVIRKKCWALLDMLIHASITQKIICSSSCSSSVVFRPSSISW